MKGVSSRIPFPALAVKASSSSSATSTTTVYGRSIAASQTRWGDTDSASVVPTEHCERAAAACLHAKESHALFPDCIPVMGILPDLPVMSCNAVEHHASCMHVCSSKPSSSFRCCNRSTSCTNNLKDSDSMQQAPAGTAVISLEAPDLPQAQEAVDLITVQLASECLENVGLRAKLVVAHDRLQAVELKVQQARQRAEAAENQAQVLAAKLDRSCAEVSGLRVGMDALRERAAAVAHAAAMAEQKAAAAQEQAAAAEAKLLPLKAQLRQQQELLLQAFVAGIASHAARDSTDNRGVSAELTTAIAHDAMLTAESSSCRSFATTCYTMAHAAPSISSPAASFVNSPRRSAATPYTPADVPSSLSTSSTAAHVLATLSLPQTAATVQSLNAHAAAKAAAAEVVLPTEFHICGDSGDSGEPLPEVLIMLDSELAIDQHHCADVACTGHGARVDTCGKLKRQWKLGGLLACLG